MLPRGCFGCPGRKLGASEVSFVQVKVSDVNLRSHEVPVHGAPCELKSTRGYTKSVEPWPDR